MQRVRVIAVLALFIAAPLAAQQRDVIITIYGGGADHLADLEPSPPAWFMPGYSLGASVGLQLNKWWAVHGDFTYTRNPVEGSGPLTGGDVNRFFYGAHAEYQWLGLRNVRPYAFAGFGAVSIDQLGAEAFDPTTRPALMYGGGLFYGMAGGRFDLVGEIKGLTYNWNMAGYDRSMIDVTYSVGLSYRIPVSW